MCYNYAIFDYSIYIYNLTVNLQHFNSPTLRYWEALLLFFLLFFLPLPHFFFLEEVSLCIPGPREAYMSTRQRSACLSLLNPEIRAAPDSCFSAVVWLLLLLLFACLFWLEFSSVCQPCCFLVFCTPQFFISEIKSRECFPARQYQSDEGEITQIVLSSVSKLASRSQQLPFK